MPRIIKTKSTKLLEEIITIKDNEIKNLTNRLDNYEKMKLDAIKDMLYIQDLEHETQLRILKNDYSQIIKIKDDEFSELKKNYDILCEEADSLETEINEITIFRNNEVENLKNYIKELVSNLDKLKNNQNDTRTNTISNYLNQFLIDKFRIVENRKFRCHTFRNLFQDYLKTNKIPHLNRIEISYVPLLMRQLGYKQTRSNTFYYNNLVLK